MKKHYLALAIAALGASFSSASFAQSTYQISNTESIGSTLKNYQSLSGIAENTVNSTNGVGTATTPQGTSSGSLTGSITNAVSGAAGVSGGAAGTAGTALSGLPGYSGGALGSGSTGGSSSLGGLATGAVLGGVLGSTNNGSTVPSPGSYGVINPGVNVGSGSGSSDLFSLDNLAKAGQIVGGVVGGNAGTIAVGIGGAVGTYNNCGGITDGVTVNCAMNLATTATAAYAATHKDSSGAQTATRILGVANGANLVQRVTGVNGDQYIGESSGEYTSRQQELAMQSIVNSPSYQNAVVTQPASNAVDNMDYQSRYNTNIGPVNQTNQFGTSNDIVRNDGSYVYNDPNSIIQRDADGVATVKTPLGGGVPMYNADGSPISYSTSGTTPVRSPVKMQPETSAWSVPQSTNTVSTSSDTSSAAYQALMKEQSNNIVTAQQTYRNAVATYGASSPQASSAQMAVDGLVKAYTPKTSGSVW